jgi:hypothetical protein
MVNIDFQGDIVASNAFTDDINAPVADLFKSNNLSNNGSTAPIIIRSMNLAKLGSSFTFQLNKS